MLIKKINSDPILNLCGKVSEPANMCPSNEDVRHSPLSSDLLEGVLHVSALCELVELVQVVLNVS